MPHLSAAVVQTCGLTSATAPTSHHAVSSAGKEPVKTCKKYAFILVASFFRSLRTVSSCFASYFFHVHETHIMFTEHFLLHGYTLEERF